ncbi:unnamed protein product [Brassica oleracea]
MDISMLEKFLLEQIKVGGKPGVLSDSVPLRETKERSLLTSPPIPTSPNVIRNKFLTFFLCLLKRRSRICLRSCRRKNTFSMMHKERRAATTSLPISM